MRRWNGWGDESDHFELSDDAREFLRARIGEGSTPHDATLEEALREVPASRLGNTARFDADARLRLRSEEHTSELQSLMRISYAVFCLKKNKQQTHRHNSTHPSHIHLSNNA